DVIAVLEGTAFERLPMPFSVAGTEFHFEAGALGTGLSHDLVLVATEQMPRLRLQRLIAGHARAMDVAGSRRPMSLVFLGKVASNDRTELERYARVLPIGTRTPNVAQIEQAVAVLLPLKMPAAELVHGSDPINEVLAVLGPATTSEHLALMNAAEDGPEAVRETLRTFTNDGAGWSDDEKETDDD